LSSIESQYGRETESLEGAKFEEWKKNGLTWQKEIISEALILKYRIGDRVGSGKDNYGIIIDPPFLSEIRNEVWTHFENLPPEEIRDVDRGRAVSEFEKVISSSLDLPDATKEVFIESLKKPFCSRENFFRTVVGLNPLQGGEDVYEKI
jgi:hypothetical protein